MAFYGTQGGGTAEMRGNTLVWREPPVEFPEMKVGDSVPEEWGIVGPFDDETNMPFEPEEDR